MPNIAPSGQNGLRVANEDNVIWFYPTDFGFTDADGNSFTGIVITSVPSGGELRLGRPGNVGGVSSTLVQVGQFISAAQLNGTNGLFYLPAANGHGDADDNFAYDNFTFQVRDNGGTADGGADTDPTPNVMAISIMPQPDAPVIFHLGISTVVFVENTPVFIDQGQNALVADVDNTDFGGGQLYIGFTANSPDVPFYEDFSIADGNGITVTSQAVGGLVQYFGVTFGVITIDQDGLLQVDFNDESTLNRVSALIRQITYEAISENPFANDREPVLVLKDGDGGERLIEGINIEIDRVNDIPVLNGLDPTVVFSTEEALSGPQLIDSDVAFTDPDDGLSQAVLQLRGALANDVLGIRNEGNGPGEVGVSAGVVRYGGVVVASVVGGTGPTGPLTVRFNSDATAAAVDAVIENLTFMSTGVPAATRTLDLEFRQNPSTLILQSIEVRVGDQQVGGAGDDTLTGTPGVDYLDGLGGDDTLYGLGDNDTLDGGTGVDHMEGGAGNDLYLVDNAGDVIVEAGGGGNDEARTSVDYALGAGVWVEELVAGQGTGAIDLTGNELDNILTGNAGNNILRGADGDDDLFGGDGDDFLNGDAGADRMVGGNGADTYYVDNAGDVIDDGNAAFVDRVVTTLSYVLTDQSGFGVDILEAASLASTERLDLTGNFGHNTLRGSQGVNVLRGEGGNDILFGYGGDDFLVGGTGNDTLHGGLGDDTYYLYTGDQSDVIVELAGEGRDRVATLVSVTLTAGQSIEVLEALNSLSTDAMNLIGNGFDNLIAGNQGVNLLRGNDGNDELVGYAGNDALEGGNGDDILNGGIGDDLLTGGAGSDKYFVQDAGDVIVEGVATGEDRVATSISFALAEGVDIEILEPITFNSTEALNFFGNEFGQFIIGNNGANWLSGGGGVDRLEGLGGADSFLFTAAIGNGNIDTIDDFLPGTDRILLDDAVFTGLNAGALPAGAFVTGASAQDADDRIVYNSATGALFFDADGNGSGVAVQFATVTAGLTINASDFLVI